MNEWKALKEYLQSLKLQDDCENAYKYISKALKSGSNCFNMEVLNKYKENSDFMELYILNQIFLYIDSKDNIEYISCELANFEIQRVSDNIIVQDNILTSSIMSFIYSMFAIMSSPNDSVVFENCFKNIIVALDLQGRHLKLGTYNTEKVIESLKMPDNIIHIASDIYYSIWTFQVAHEIYHILCGKEENSIDQEIKADKYGYSILIKLIEQQKYNEIIEECRCFYEYTYLSPIILFEYYRLKSFWEELCGVEIKVDNLHPSNKQREDMFFSLSDKIIPKDFDTKEGNIIINIFLDTMDYIIENIRIKAESGKLDSIIKRSEI